MSQENSGKFIPGKSNVEILLVIAKGDIKLRTLLFDELRLKDQGFDVGFGFNVRDVMRGRDHSPDARVRGLAVGIQALLERSGLTYINILAQKILKTINTRRIGCFRDMFLEIINTHDRRTL